MTFKEYNQNIKSNLTSNFESSKQKFQEIAKDIHPLFVKAVNELLGLDFSKLKNETLEELLQSCEKWLNDADYTNTPMDALVFEYNYSCYAKIIKSSLKKLDLRDG